MTYISKVPLSRYDFVCQSRFSSPSIPIEVIPYRYAPKDWVLVGISKFDVTEIDLMKHKYADDSVPLSTLMPIIQTGVIKLNIPYDNIPISQDLYLDSAGTVTWRRVGPRIGIAWQPQVLDGELEISLELARF